MSPIFWQRPPKTYWNNFQHSFLNVHQHAKSQFILSIHSWQTVNIKILWTNWPHPFWIMSIPNFLINFYFMWICINIEKKQWFQFQWFVLEIHGWLKYPGIWFSENIVAHISETKIFPIMGFVQKSAFCAFSLENKICAFSLENNFSESEWPNFSLNLKHPVFGPIMVHFPKFVGKKASPTFFQLCVTGKFIWISSTMPKFRKN